MLRRVKLNPNGIANDFERLHQLAGPLGYGIENRAQSLLSFTFDVGDGIGQVQPKALVVDSLEIRKRIVLENSLLWVSRGRTGPIGIDPAFCAVAIIMTIFRPAPTTSPFTSPPVLPFPNLLLT